MGKRTVAIAIGVLAAVLAAGSPSFGGISCTDGTCYVDPALGPVFFCINEQEEIGQVYVPSDDCRFVGSAEKDANGKKTKFSLKDGALVSGICECGGGKELSLKFKATRDDATGDGKAEIKACGDTAKYKGELGTFQSCD